MIDSGQVGRESGEEGWRHGGGRGALQSAGRRGPWLGSRAVAAGEERSDSGYTLERRICYRWDRGCMRERGVEDPSRNLT